MFWKYGGYAHVSPINSLLDKPDVTVEDILDESDLMQELKGHNTRLIEYLRDDNVLRRLFDIIISPSLLDENDEYEDEDGDGHIPGEKEKDKEGGTNKGTSEGGEGKIEHEYPKVSLSADLDPEDLENAEQSRLKYAYIASEVLASPTWSIIEAMMLNQEALKDFWHYLWRKEPLDSLQTSYFVKVNEVFLDLKTEDMLSFVMSLDDIIPTILRHVDNPLIMDLLLKIISMDKVDGGLGVTEWLQKQNLIPIFLSYISKEHSQSTQTAAGDFLKALVTISANAAQNEQPCIGPNNLTRQLVSEPCIQTLILSMLDGGNPLTVGVGIVIDIIRKNNPDFDPEMADSRDSPPAIYDPIYLGTMLRSFASYLPQFMDLVESKRKHNAIAQLDTAWGTKIEPLGFDRFKACELMAELLHCSNMGLHNEPGSHEHMHARDAERDQLQAQGSYKRQEDDSGFVYAENTNDFAPSRSGSPDELKRFDSPNAGEEDGFEDMASSGILIDKIKDDAFEETTEVDAKSGVGAFTNVPKLGVGDDFVDEPLTPPKQEPVSIAKDAQKDDVHPPEFQSKNAVSPTSSNLTEQVEGFKIGAEKASSPEPQDTVNQKDTPNSEVTVKPTQSSTGDKIHSAREDSTQATLSTPQARPTDEGATTSKETHKEPITPEITVESDRQIQTDPDGRPVVGDYLKIMFYQNKVVPTVVSYFFRFPWNNFLHNVVYDIVQQLLNGSMELGFNKSLVLDLFGTAQITTQIIDCQRRSEESESTKKMRLGNMGHLTLIAEEVVKFSGRHALETISPIVMEKLTHPDWNDYVENALAETRERENAILGGVKPDISMSHRQAVLNSIGAGQGFSGTSTALANAGLNGGFSNNTGLDSLSIGNQASASGGAFGSSTLFSGFGSSSDDDDEEMEDFQQESQRGKLWASNADGASADNAAGSDNSESQPIPILPPPPAPLNLGPSRARRQLAARLALQKQQATDAEASTSTETSEKGADDTPVHGGEDVTATAAHVSPFSTSFADEDDNTPQNGHEISQESASRLPRAGSPTPPPLFLSNFEQPGGYSSSSSDEDSREVIESIERKTRFPVEVYDDDDMGDMVGPTNTYSDDDDDDDETIIREALGYSSFVDPGRHPGDDVGYSPSGDLTVDSTERNDSSDGEEEGLVEILVPGRRPPPS